MRIEKPHTVEVIGDGAGVIAWRHDLGYLVLSQTVPARKCPDASWRESADYVWLLTPDEAIQRDRQFAHANARGVPDGIGDRTGRSGDADLAHAFDTERVDMRIVFLDQNRFERSITQKERPVRRFGSTRGDFTRCALNAWWKFGKHFSHI